MNSSQGRRFMASLMGRVLMYSLSEGNRAFIFSMSSVASCRITSSISSAVTMPTMRPSLSTMGTDSRSYFLTSSATYSLSSRVLADTKPVVIIFSIGASSGAISSRLNGRVPIRCL